MLGASVAHHNMDAVVDKVCRWSRLVGPWSRLQRAPAALYYHLVNFSMGGLDPPARPRSGALRCLHRSALQRHARGAVWGVSLGHGLVDGRLLPTRFGVPANRWASELCASMWWVAVLGSFNPCGFQAPMAQSLVSRRYGLSQHSPLVAVALALDAIQGVTGCRKGLRLRCSKFCSHDRWRLHNALPAAQLALEPPRRCRDL